MTPGYYGNDNDDKKTYQKTVAMCVAAASLVILLFLVILYVNSDTPEKKTASQKETTQDKEEDEFLTNSHNITSDELDFWSDKKNPTPVPDEEEGELTPYKDPSGTDNNTDNENSDDTVKTGDEGEGSLNKDSSDVEDKDKEGYITVEDEKGKKTYYEIIESLEKNDYDLENDLITENGLLKYKDSKRESIAGVDLSKYNGTVDFAKLKEAGIKFAMLRLGSRGYGTGKITLDEKFVEYAQNAMANGIQIGAYFYSQAVNETEAVEEANYIVGAVSGFAVKYPIAIDIERVTGDEARTDKLTNKERTAVVKSFCDTVKGYGYKPIVYATCEMLVGGLNLEELDGYDVWLADDKVPSKYPYKYSMLQYNKQGHIDGITGDIDLDISFVNYEQK